MRSFYGHRLPFFFVDMTHVEVFRENGTWDDIQPAELDKSFENRVRIMF